MANWYVWSGATGTASGTSWANAKTTLAAAFTAGAAGDDFWVAHDHAETQATALTLNCPGLVTNPCRIVCVNRAGSVPPVSADLRTTATITTTGASALSINGVAYYYGITFSCADGSSNANLSVASTANTFHVFDNCTFKLPSSNISCRFIIGSTSGGAQRVEMVNSNAYMVGGTFRIICPFIWRGGTFQLTGASTLFVNGAGVCMTAYFLGVDLSAQTPGSALVDPTIGASGEYVFQDCRLASGALIVVGAPAGQGGTRVRLINCDSGATNYRYYLQDYQTVETRETVIVRTGGATDGVTPISCKVVANANNKFRAPHRGDWLSFWNPVAGLPITVAIPVVTDGVTLKDLDAWLEVEALGNAGYPLGALFNDGPADILAAGTNQATDTTSVWTTTGLASPVKQLLSVTLTPQMAGYLRARVCVGIASATVYYDPAPINAAWAKYGAMQYTVGESGMVQAPNPTGAILVF